MLRKIIWFFNTQDKMFEPALKILNDLLSKVYNNIISQLNGALHQIGMSCTCGGIQFFWFLKQIIFGKSVWLYNHTIFFWYLLQMVYMLNMSICSWRSFIVSGRSWYSGSPVACSKSSIFPKDFSNFCFMSWFMQVCKSN